ncbi:type II toxin-antitoxin system HicB family antitoxin [Candidatus Acetothermia bacterium]|jgi:predicted RNase H-like HicB family nuclease|nr:type II toxin-antitoxin system HicB family antitoxin [Candidatus Acetothermia bacterium]MCI2432182.1 type II toxin-antitoxin system HicB family antitoxin [Candidatus Acetothermia bacterium]
MATKAARKQLRYTVIFEPAEEGGYIVRVPALEGCVTQGDTLQEARDMAKDAIEGYLAVLQEEGLPIPEDIETKPVYEKVTVHVRAVTA